MSNQQGMNDLENSDHVSPESSYSIPAEDQPRNRVVNSSQIVRQPQPDEVLVNDINMEVPIQQPQPTVSVQQRNNGATDVQQQNDQLDPEILRQIQAIDNATAQMQDGHLVNREVTNNAQANVNPPQRRRRPHRDQMTKQMRLRYCARSFVNQCCYLFAFIILCTVLPFNIGLDDKCNFGNLISISMWTTVMTAIFGLVSLRTFVQSLLFLCARNPRKANTIMICYTLFCENLIVVSWSFYGISILYSEEVVNCQETYPPMQTLYKFAVMAQLFCIPHMIMCFCIVPVGILQVIKYSIEQQEQMRQVRRRENPNQGVDFTKLKNIKIMKYSDLIKQLSKNDQENPESQKDDQSEEQVCAICYCEFTSDAEVGQLSCNEKHYFHFECLKQWFIKKLECPICRHQVQ